MKIEFLHHYRKRHGLTARDRLIAYLPRYAPYAARFAPLLNLRNRVPAAGARSARRLLRAQRRRAATAATGPPQPLCAAERPSPAAAEAGGERPRSRAAGRHLQPLFRAGERRGRRARADPRRLSRHDARARRSAGRCAAAAPFSPPAWSTRRATEARRMLDALAPAVAAGTPIVGLEPSCLLTLRDEFPALLPGAETKALADRAQLFEEFVDSERAAGRFDLPLAADAGPDRAAARPLPPEGVRHRRRRGQGAAADPRAQGRDLRLDLLRHGRLVRLRGRALRRCR